MSDVPDTPTIPPRPAGAVAWSPVDGWRFPAGAPVKLTVAQFRDRWTVAEQVTFEALAAEATPAGAVLRMVANNLRDRLGVGVDPTSAKTAAMAGLCVQHGALAADRVSAITAPVGARPGEPGYVAEGTP